MFYCAVVCPRATMLSRVENRNDCWLLSLVRLNMYLGNYLQDIACNVLGGIPQHTVRLKKNRPSFFITQVSTDIVSLSCTWQQANNGWLSSLFCWNSRETAPKFPLFYWYYDTYLGIPGFFRIKFSAFPRLIPRISMDNTRLKIETPRNSKSHIDT